jgi:cupin fold WbuC family metalloprotein
MIAGLTRINDEVFAADDRIVRLGAPHVTFLRERAVMSPRRRARICAHRGSGDGVQEMLIAACADSYIRPHKHPGKIESFHVVAGSVDVVVLDDGGAIIEVIELGDFASGRPFYYRLADCLFHTLLIHSSILVMHEVTDGPFVADATVLAPFAPPESLRHEALAFQTELRCAAAAHRSAGRQAGTT